jgi:hypothetical protein
MHQDPLSDVLRSVRLRGAVFFYVSYPDGARSNFRRLAACMSKFS